MNILFVCTGNTCRSPMAEVIFNSINKNKNNKAFSAGASVVPGSSISLNSALTIKDKLNKDISNRKAQQLQLQHIINSDLLLTMTDNIKLYLQRLYPQHKDKIYTLNEYIGENGDILDPYGGDISIYEKTFDMLLNRIKKLIIKIK
ncbi:low molecular weight protein arginine phosphatase [Clostridium oryzae]|uniref:Low molecular weight protein-tyrosine-phosphatase YwlE n=1 Tax=Clostridium oryzae TaxID=1450648 RepID=A0A1V4IU05_9CLOT|nr:low molecular weight protein arginine phosphatase [Clostridium oryzae]OPJ63416.1 Low molecular weight protein-tyrosine-phosphatase YwlE [Clostridium oryzae]